RGRQSPKGSLLTPRSHAPRGIAPPDAPRRVSKARHLTGRRASRRAFPRGAWERELCRRRRRSLFLPLALGLHLAGDGAAGALQRGDEVGRRAEDRAQDRSQRLLLRRQLGRLLEGDDLPLGDGALGGDPVLVLGGPLGVL